jgi:flagellar biosynthetic protein FlhB
MAESAGEKKHPASEQRRRKARENGQVVRSQDLASAALLLCAVLVLRIRGPAVASGLLGMFRQAISTASPAPLSTQDASALLLQQALQTAWLAAPLMLIIFVAAILCNVLQTGPLLATSKLVPNFNHINPLSGVKRLFSLPSVMRLAFGLFKVLVVSAVAYFALARIYQQVLLIGQMSLGQLAAMLFTSCIDTSLWIGAALLILAIFEYAFQWWKHEQDLKMTDQELRDELKETMGDPQLVGKRRQIQRQLAMDRVGQAVPTADVVVTNPTELAVALKYDPQTMVAPTVVAKGAGVIAQRIRRLALENAVPIVERKPLAQALYKSVEVGDVIPLDQYQAVAEVLKYVYQLKGEQPPLAA